MRDLSAVVVGGGRRVELEGRHDLARESRIERSESETCAASAEHLTPWQVGQLCNVYSSTGGTKRAVPSKTCARYVYENSHVYKARVAALHVVAFLLGPWDFCLVYARRLTRASCASRVCADTRKLSFLAMPGSEVRASSNASKDTAFWYSCDDVGQKCTQPPRTRPAADADALVRAGAQSPCERRDRRPSRPHLARGVARRRSVPLSWCLGPFFHTLAWWESPHGER